MQKIAINRDYGGFWLSDACISLYLKKKNILNWPDTKIKDASTFWLLPPGPDRIDSKDYDYHSMSIEERMEHNNLWETQVFDRHKIARDCPTLIETIEELGTEAAAGNHSVIKIVCVPDDVVWELEDYDGIEWISEVHRTWD